MFPNREEEPVERFGGGQVKGGKRAKTKREWEKGEGGGRERVGSPRSNRFGHANATPLFDFNQVLNTSIVAHLRYSHHHRSSATLSLSLFFHRFFSLPLSPLYRVVVHWFGDWRPNERRVCLQNFALLTLCVSRVRVKDQEDEET